MSVLVCLLTLGAFGSGDSPAPSDVLELSGWSLTIPVDADGDGAADEVPAERLRGYRDPRHFHVDEAGRVVFRAACGAPTTRGSNYPRCELRQREGDLTYRIALIFVGSASR